MKTVSPPIQLFLFSPISFALLLYPFFSSLLSSPTQIPLCVQHQCGRTLQLISNLKILTSLSSNTILLVFSHFICSNSQPFFPPLLPKSLSGYNIIVQEPSDHFQVNNIQWAPNHFFLPLPCIEFFICIYNWDFSFIKREIRGTCPKELYFLANCIHYAWLMKMF